MLPKPGAWIQSLVRELRTYMLQGAAKKHKNCCVTHLPLVPRVISTLVTNYPKGSPYTGELNALHGLPASRLLLSEGVWLRLLPW